MTEPRDPLDRLADLTLPAPDPARMRADIARARAAFIGAEQAPAPAKAPRRATWLSPLRLGLAGSSLAGMAAVFLMLPAGQTGDRGRGGFGQELADMGEGAYPAPASAGATEESRMAAADTMPASPSAGPSVGASAGAAETAPALAGSTQPDPGETPLPQIAGAAPDLPSPAPAPASPSRAPAEAPRPGTRAPAAARAPAAIARPADPVPAARAPAMPGGGTTTLPPLGARPGRASAGDTALVDLEREETDDVFSGSASFSISADQDGIWLERPSGPLEIPIGELPADMTIRMSDLFMLPARGGLPQFLVLRGQQDERLTWQVFRVEEAAVIYDRIITGLVKDARSAGQVETMIARLPPPD